MYKYIVLCICLFTMLFLPPHFCIGYTYILMNEDAYVLYYSFT